MSNIHEPAYPALDRRTYLIEHACVPAAVPSQHKEATQLLSALTALLQQNNRKEKSSDV